MDRTTAGHAPFRLSTSRAGVRLREAYLTPPDGIAEEVLAPRHRNVTLNNESPNGEHFLNAEQTGLAQLGDYARPHYNLAGLQIDPQANRVRGDARALQTPDGARLSTYRWSPDGSQLAFFAHFDDETHLYVADLSSGESSRVTEQPVLATLTTSFEWSGDSRYLFAVVTPEGHGTAPATPALPSGPVVRKTTEENPLRTYSSLLEDRHEAELLEHYVKNKNGPAPEDQPAEVADE